MIIHTNNVRFTEKAKVQGQTPIAPKNRIYQQKLQQSYHVFQKYHTFSFYLINYDSVIVHNITI